MMMTGMKEEISRTTVGITDAELCGIKDLSTIDNSLVHSLNSRCK
jgi:hypothetical protein